ncbi:D-amino-acid transaminase [Beggiatoa leptomitoformis]|uniref:D-alanine aminotransferase n=1 Tax=Beggiatoa leptomitoformis TaxID=288004 RepID=A0A2N9YJP5_9GAMM|nr:D-amino-acid transaminase [Beggiatoa leptomitoformis]ALG69328.1 D-amino-acid transaminase [Beggiatoa leptomitoformis]AUI70486.1 D-amino-acid transaminase [Beggiatoa leptomitoformis]
MIVYLNGEFLPLAEAKIPVLDRGFIFGDGIYEVIPVYDGQLFRIQEHLQRLENSLAKIQLINPYTRADWLRFMNVLIERNGGGSQTIYLQVTRGVEKRQHHFPDSVTPTVLMTSSPFSAPVKVTQGYTAITRPDIRWLRCDIKSTALLGNVLLRQEAIANDAKETILIRDGYLTEGAATNVFIVIKGVVMTPPKTNFILHGITRDVLIEFLQRAGIPCQETPVSESQLRTADEIWLTSTSLEVAPVTRLDNKPVGSGQVGAVWSHAWDVFQTFKQQALNQ